MKKISLVLVIISVLVLAGCGKNADIGWEGISIKVLEYSKVPSNYIEGTSYGDKMVEYNGQMVKQEGGTFDIMRIEVTGTPQDTFMAYEALNSMEILDSKGQGCVYGSAILEGTETNILTAEKGYVTFLIDCGGNGGERTIIVRNSDNELLDSISAKWKMTPSEKLSNELKILLEKWSESEKTNQKQESEIQAKSDELKKSLADVQTKANELQADESFMKEALADCIVMLAKDRGESEDEAFIECIDYASGKYGTQNEIYTAFEAALTKKALQEVFGNYQTCVDKGLSPSYCEGIK